MISKRFIPAYLSLAMVLLGNCQDKNDNLPPEQEEEVESDFYFGADLSYVNQILDFGGVYKDNGVTEDPYKIFGDYGTNLIRLRLWHNPEWTGTVYGNNGTQLYNGLFDVEKALASAKENGMSTLLDFHYSDIWADPGRQEIPAAWQEITSLDVLRDSVYNYTFKTLDYLDGKGLLPEFVQIGNETNCGMFYSNAPADFPKLNACNGNWANLGEVVNSAIQAVQDASNSKEIKIILHVADPVHVDWWFDNITNNGKVTNFGIIGFSYYPIWHTEVTLDQLSQKVSTFKTKFGKDIMMLETAYPWTTAGNDGYTNIFGGQNPISGYPFTEDGQLAILKKMTQELMYGGAMGIIYWEPAWISSDMKDLWGTGSSWENCTFFDFDGNVLPGMDYMKHPYTK